jgi:hypothetical protein
VVRRAVRLAAAIWLARWAALQVAAALDRRRNV